MASPRVDGAHPQRAGADGVSSTGSTPRIGADARARSQQLAQQFAAQIEMSMMQSLTQLSAGGEGGDDASGEGADDANAGIGIDSSMQQMLLISSLFSASSKASGASAAQLQAQLSSMGLGSLGATTAGAGSEAQLAQQLLGSYGATGSAATGAAGADSAVGVDRGASENAKVVAQVARERGVDPAVAVAMMLVESGGRATAVGDGGTSFGLFQLHEGGILTAAGLTKEQAFDPRTNANVALKSYRHEWSKGHERRTPGEIAAASQRPADPVGYAAKVNAAMDRARSLVGGD